MLLKKSSQCNKNDPQADISKIITQVSSDYLKYLIEKISIPRHYIAERENNRKTAFWLKEQFLSYGYDVFFQGTYDNVIAVPSVKSEKPFLIAATHYDTVPRSPGADDNGSGMAVLLSCAKILSECHTPNSTMFIMFNCEEDGLLGSKDFVSRYLKENKIEISEVHVMEMVGYCSHELGSQKFPDNLPIKLPDIGDFLGIIGNSNSNKIAEILLKDAATYIDDFPVIGLKVYLGAEKYFSHLQRSDHSPFWQAKIPALMWTDTAEFRNRNYHSTHDKPETLNYEFMKKVTQLLLVKILTHEYNKYFYRIRIWRIFMSITEVTTKKGKTVYAVIVLLFSIGFPLYLLSHAKKIKIDIITILVSSLYFIAVFGFIFLIFKIEDVRLKALEIDRKSQGRINKLKLFLLTLMGINMIYNLVKYILGLFK